MKRTTFWMAYLSSIVGGKERVVDELQSLQLDACLSIRIGQAGRLEGGIDEKTVQYFQDKLGRDRVEIWWGSSPSTVHGEVYQAKKFHAIGVRRFVVNAETAWKFAGSNTHAAQYSEMLLKALPDSFIAHAPFAMWQSHGTGSAPFPYVGFAALHHAFNQLYPNEFGGSREYWNARYERELKAFREANPILLKQSCSILGDLYGSSFGRSWGLKPAPVEWSDEHLTAHLALSERLGDSEIAFYSIDAAISESDRTKSKPFSAVKRWAKAQATFREEIMAAEAKKFTSEQELMCLHPSMAEVCWGEARFKDHVPEPE